MEGIFNDMVYGYFILLVFVKGLKSNGVDVVGDEVVVRIVGKVKILFEYILKYGVKMVRIFVIVVLYFL